MNRSDLNNSMLNLELEDSLFILTATANEIHHLIEAAIEVLGKQRAGDKLSNEQKLTHGALLFTIIRTDSFMVEWHDYFGRLATRGIETERIRKVQRVCKPALTEIKRFSSINEYRNLLAHNVRLRDTGNANAFRSEYVAKLIIPVSIADYLLIGDCIMYCKSILSFEFPEYNKLTSEFIAENGGNTSRVGMTLEEAHSKSEALAELITKYYHSYTPDESKREKL